MWSMVSSNNNNNNNNMMTGKTWVKIDWSVGGESVSLRRRTVETLMVTIEDESEAEHKRLDILHFSLSSFLFLSSSFLDPFILSSFSYLSCLC